MRWLRDALGITHLHRVLHRLEKAVASAKEQLDALVPVVSDIAADVRVILNEDRESFSAEGQAAFDRLKESLTALDTEVGDKDGSDTPPVEPSTF